MPVKVNFNRHCCLIAGVNIKTNVLPHGVFFLETPWYYNNKNAGSRTEDPARKKKNNVTPIKTRKPYKDWS